MGEGECAPDRAAGLTADGDADAVPVEVRDNLGEDAGVAVRADGGELFLGSRAGTGTCARRRMRSAAARSHSSRAA
ncbi:hypothetical protein GCM10010260_73170 [Streptomyces filipinensis]|uniref:Uncharacterized protein n=1 Tax=Streptomyces filipinensis TaxID=66887 RepID=A0A918IIY1_9ACTN|nr:hypothetical protein GCM10010260_73170 [Streptomyces filipinensis]